MELGHSNKHFIKNSSKKDPAVKDFEIFLLDPLKTTF